RPARVGAARAAMAGLAGAVVVLAVVVASVSGWTRLRGRDSARDATPDPTANARPLPTSSTVETEGRHDLWESFPANQGDNGFYTYAYAAATDTYHPLARATPHNFQRPDESRWSNPHVFRADVRHAYASWPQAPWIGLVPSGT